jgi:hypothetical protein
VDISSAYNDFGGLLNAPNYPNGNAFATVNIRGNFCIVAVLMATTTTHCLSTIHDHLCIVT